MVFYSALSRLTAGMWLSVILCIINQRSLRAIAAVTVLLLNKKKDSLLVVAEGFLKFHDFSRFTFHDFTEGTNVTKPPPDWMSSPSFGPGSLLLERQTLCFIMESLTVWLQQNTKSKCSLSRLTGVDSLIDSSPLRVIACTLHYKQVIGEHCWHLFFLLQGSSRKRQDLTYSAFNWRCCDRTVC